MIETTELTKRYGPTTAVDALTFTATPGQITGFVGPNGAGKTTTLRILLGLVRADAGRALIGGRRYADLGRPVEEVGAVLEATGFHPDRSARNHLKATCMATGLPRRRVDEVLELVELTEVADHAAGGFSHGMRQRLTLATALLGDPKTLIVDEPPTAWTPPGCAGCAASCGNLPKAGRTVLVSSHVLSEVEQTVDHVVIIAAGRLLRDAPLAELTGPTRALRLRTARTTQLTKVLERAGARIQHQDRDRLVATGVTAEQVAEAAAGAGIRLTELTRQQPRLEEVYVELTANQRTPQGPVAGTAPGATTTERPR